MRNAAFADGASPSSGRLDALRRDRLGSAPPDGSAIRILTGAAVPIWADTVAGATPIEPHRFRVVAGQVLAGTRDRRQFLRGRLQHDAGVLTVRKFRSDSSGMLSSLTWSDGLIDLRPADSAVPAGDHVEFIPYSEFLS
jgi:molybdopterin biosynthesis enzyme